MLYSGEKTKTISFPLGGIGTGSMGLASNGALVDWEIFNQPNKNSYNGFSHFAVKAESPEEVVDARVLISDIFPPYTGVSNDKFQGFGFGVTHFSLQGLPHFKSDEFIGEFPFATVRFKDKSFPGRPTLIAFNPFIPLNDRDSSIPAAFFTIEIKNPTARRLKYTVAAVLRNPHTACPVSKLTRAGQHKIITLSSNKEDADAPEYGDISLGTDADDVSYQQHWYRGRWFDNLEVYWQDFNRPGKFKNRVYSVKTQDAKTKYDDHATLAAHFELAPGRKQQVRFIITWNYPNMTNYWNPEPSGPQRRPKIWKNYYISLFKDSRESAQYALRNWDRLYEETGKFQKALFSSTVPDYVLDAISANISILKSPTVLRLEDGSFYGFEGCHPTSGCCEGTCTHVWNYAYALPFLFPGLERSLRALEYNYSLGNDESVGFRLQLPLGRGIFSGACCDGQFGGVVKAYREWRISGNDRWLWSHWPAIKKSLEFAWSKTNEHRWDRNKDGVLEGRQHHTLDVELFGPNSYLTGFYLTALKAGAEIAAYFEENEKAREYRQLFARGKAWVDKNLFNGEYYYQKIDLSNKTLLKPYQKHDKNIEAYYWDAEHGQIKYQIAEGCHCDQVIAQWHANLIGLGEIFDKKQVKKALKSIYKYNFKKSMRKVFNPCRIYALNDEKALVICAWPKGNKPAVPVPYAEEAMNGFEYQVAVHMIQEGLIKEGLAIVRAIRDRYDGEKRNP
ncbi:non-lysosomal glucosylceramidase [candidate division NPL-UPA2 bacterium]|nr:non-lysosomal glucosylceramidase [candidate division NPL-UPA2 bacterium]